MTSRTLLAALVSLAASLCACVGTDPDIASTTEGRIEQNDSSSPREASTPEEEQVVVAPDAPISLTTLRNPSAPGHPSFGARVTIAGVVVTGLKTAGATHGFFVQDPKATSWGGIYVWVAGATVTVAKGDVVTVTGLYRSYRGDEQIFADQTPPAKTGTSTLPPAIVVSPKDIAEGGARVRELQSMRLRVEGVEVSRQTEGVDFGVRPLGQPTAPELVVTSFVANDIGPSPFDGTAGTTYASITGFGYAFGTTDTNAIAKLAPESAADLVR
jgi:hypothetical protein